MTAHLVGLCVVFELGYEPKATKAVQRAARHAQQLVCSIHPELPPAAVAGIFCHFAAHEVRLRLVNTQTDASQCTYNRHYSLTHSLGGPVAHCLHRRARLGCYDIVGQIDVAVVCALLVGLCLCAPLAARPPLPAPTPPQNQVPTPGVEAVRRAAQQGDTGAQYNLGVLYVLGQGVPQDDVEGTRWLRLAADQGYALAEYNLGVMYDNGRGVPQDDAEATRWFRLAADQGFIPAQHKLGVMYETGRGVPQDSAEAVRWYRLAADQGWAEAQHYLGVMYAGGLGVPQDYVAAHMWLNLAAAQASDADSDAVIDGREVVEAEMTAEQIAEAQRLAREWKPIDER